MSSLPGRNRVIAAVALVNAAGEVLLQLRDDRPDISDPGCWVVPGGGVEPGESVEAAARRELQEETGYVATDLAPVFNDTLTRPGLTEQRHFFVSTYDGSQTLVCGEGQEIRFMAAHETDQVRLGSGHIDLLRRVFALIREASVRRA